MCLYFIIADEPFARSNEEEMEEETGQPVPSPNIIPPSPPHLPDIQAPRSCRGRGKGVRGYQKGLPTHRGRGRGARLTQTSTQVCGDTVMKIGNPR